MGLMGLQQSRLHLEPAWSGDSILCAMPLVVHARRGRQVREVDGPAAHQVKTRRTHCKGVPHSVLATVHSQEQQQVRRIDAHQSQLNSSSNKQQGAHRKTMASTAHVVMRQQKCCCRKPQVLSRRSPEAHLDDGLPLPRLRHIDLLHLLQPKAGSVSGRASTGDLDDAI